MNWNEYQKNRDKYFDKMENDVSEQDKKNIKAKRRAVETIFAKENFKDNKNKILEDNSFKNDD